MAKLKDNARRALIDQRKTQILSAAALVFARKGFERATIADIAKQAGVAEGSIYNYFKNKGDLLVSLPQQMLRPTIESLRQQLLQVTAAPAPPEVILDQLAHRMLGAMQQNAHLFRILLSAMPGLKPAARQKYLDGVVLYATGMFEGYLRLGIERGIFRPDLDPRITPRLFIGMFFPFILINEVLQVQEPVPFDYDRVVAEAVRLFLQGALAEAQEGQSQ